MSQTILQSSAFGQHNSKLPFQFTANQVYRGHELSLEQQQRLYREMLVIGSFDGSFDAFRAALTCENSRRAYSWAYERALKANAERN